MPCFVSSSVKAALVNWRTWSVLNIVCCVDHSWFFSMNRLTCLQIACITVRPSIEKFDAPALQFQSNSSARSSVEASESFAETWTGTPQSGH